MKRNQSNAASSTGPEDFKVIPWVRTIRDTMYDETKEMTPAEFAEYVAGRAAILRTDANPA